MRSGSESPDQHDFEGTMHMQPVNLVFITRLEDGAKLASSCTLRNRKQIIY